MTRDLMEELRIAIERHREERKLKGRQLWHGFWDLPENESPETVLRPSELKLRDKIAVWCTQTELPAKAQSRLVAEWCSFLPTLKGVRFLWFHSRVPQSLFDAACRMPDLEGLYVKWSGVTNIEALESAAGLRYLFMGSSAGIVDIGPLAAMKQLRWLELENLKRVTRLDALAKLEDLDGLAFVGADGQRNSVETLRPLSNLRSLEWLHLGGIHVADGALEPLQMLVHLRWLNLGNYFDPRAFAQLAAQLPRTKCDWFGPFKVFDRSVFPCPRCRTEGRVMTSGKGSRLLCPICDAVALGRHVSLFEAARNSVAGRH